MMHLSLLEKPQISFQKKGGWGVVVDLVLSFPFPCNKSFQMVKNEEGLEKGEVKKSIIITHDSRVRRKTSDRYTNIEMLEKREIP